MDSCFRPTLAPSLEIATRSSKVIPSMPRRTSFMTSQSLFDGERLSLNDHSKWWLNSGPSKVFLARSPSTLRQAQGSGLLECAEPKGQMKFRWLHMPAPQASIPIMGSRVMRQTLLYINSEGIINVEPRISLRDTGFRVKPGMTNEGKEFMTHHTRIGKRFTWTLSVIIFLYVTPVSRGLPPVLCCRPMDPFSSCSGPEMGRPYLPL